MRGRPPRSVGPGRPGCGASRLRWCRAPPRAGRHASGPRGASTRTVRGFLAPVRPGRRRAGREVARLHPSNPVARSAAFHSTAIGASPGGETSPPVADGGAVLEEGEPDSGWASARPPLHTAEPGPAPTSRTVTAGKKSGRAPADLLDRGADGGVGRGQANSQIGSRREVVGKVREAVAHLGAVAPRERFRRPAQFGHAEAGERRVDGLAQCRRQFLSRRRQPASERP